MTMGACGSSAEANNMWDRTRDFIRVVPREVLDLDG